LAYFSSSTSPLMACAGKLETSANWLGLAVDSLMGFLSFFHLPNRRCGAAKAAPHFRPEPGSKQVMLVNSDKK
jgi:hypothetical protein